MVVKNKKNKKMIKKVVTILVVLVYIGCSGSDFKENLGGGYFFRDEGSDIKDILCEYSFGGEVPATVISYSFDDNYIIAKQKPRIHQDPLYSKVYYYKNGEDSTYYWIIIKKKHNIVGPLSRREFMDTAHKLHISGLLIRKIR